jgi:serine/threonine protein phosphatase 1
MTTYVIGDIHGRNLAFEDVLSRCKFDFQEDCLISLGDECDGGVGTKQVFDILSKIENLIVIRGNHNEWFHDWVKTGRELSIWVNQGGLATLRSYDFDRKNVPDAHIRILENSILYYIDDKNRIFVHGGFDPNKRIEFQDPDVILWDRDLIYYASGYYTDNMGKKIKVRGHNIPGYSRVFVGHTTTQFLHRDVIELIDEPDLDPFKPRFFNNLVMVDTGAGWSGKLTIMNVDTLNYWQSDIQHPNV